MAEPFPRGGSLKLPDEARPHKAARLNKRKGSTGEKPESKENRQRHDSAEKVQDRIWNSRLTYETLTSGMLLLGCVRRVEDTKIVLELPDNLEGIVDVSAVSAKYCEAISHGSEVGLLPELHHRGQLLSCVVTNKSAVGNRTIVQLSIDPDHVNRGLHAGAVKDGLPIQCSVISIEDKGYMMNIGMPSLKAFLPFREVTSWCKAHMEGDRLAIGQSILCYVKGTGRLVEGEGRVVKLSVECHLYEEPKRDQLFPGMILDCKVMPSSAKDPAAQPGIYVAVNDGQTDRHLMGFVQRRRLRSPVDPPDSYAPGSKLAVTVIYAKHNTTLLGLSANEHLQSDEFSQPDDPFLSVPSGHILSLKAQEITSSEGVYFMSDVGKKKTAEPLYGYAPRDRLHGENRIGTTYTPGTTHETRVLGFSLLDRFLFVSTKKSILREKIVAMEDAEPGMKLKGAITGISGDILFLKIYNHIDGVVERIHSADTPPSKLEGRFEIGQTVECRVLSVDLDRNRLRLTMKPALVNSEFPVVSEYDTSFTDKITDGVIVLIKKTGILVQFFGNVKGWLSKNDLMAAGVTHPERTYTVGQVVRVRMVSIVPERERINLSICLSAEEAAVAKPSFNSPIANGAEGFQLDCSFDVKIVAKLPGNGFDVSVLSEKGDVLAFLPRDHLADSVALAGKLEDSYRLGDVIKDCVFFSNGPKPSVSAKYSVVKALKFKSQPRSFEAVEPKQNIVGIIARRHADFGFFVDLPGNLSALLPYRNLDFQDKDMLAEHPCFSVNQSIQAQVWTVDPEKRKFSLNAKRTVCLPRALNQSIDDLANNLRLLERLKIGWGKSSAASIRALSEVPMGSKVKMVISEVRESSYAGTVESYGCKAVLRSDQTQKSLKKGDQLDVLVIDIDFSSLQLVVSAHKSIMKSTKDKGDVQLGVPRRVKLLHVGELYAVVAAKDDPGRLFLVPSQLYQGDIKGMSELGTKLGSEISIVPRKVVGNNTTLANLEENENTIGWVSDLAGPGAVLDPSRIPKKHVHLAPGSIYDAHIATVTPESIEVLIGGYHKGTVHATEIDCVGQEPLFPTSQFKVGEIVKVRTLTIAKTRKRTKQKVCECTIKRSKMLSKRSHRRDKLKMKNSFEPREEIQVVIKRVMPKFVEVSPNPSWTGRIPIDGFTIGSAAEVASNYPAGSLLRVYVTEVLPKIKVLKLSLVPPNTVVLNTACQATVVGTDPKGNLRLRLPDGSPGLCCLPDLADNFDEVEALMARIREKPAVECVPYSYWKGKIHVTMRASAMEDPAPSKVKDPWVRKLEDLKVGSVCRGFVSSCKLTGVFVRLSGDVMGKVPLERCSEYRLSDPQSAFPIGQLVTVKVVKSVDVPILSMLPSDTAVPDQLPQSGRLELRESRKRRRTVSGGSDVSQDSLLSETSLATSLITSQNEQRSQASANHESVTGYLDLPPEAKRLNLEGSKFSALNLMNVGLGVTAEQRDSSSEDSEAEDKPGGTKAERKKEKKRKVASVVNPLATEDFNKRILENPNNPSIWIEYMRHFLDCAEVEKARAVGRRALGTMDFRKEAAKMEIWRSLLEIEVDHGDQDFVDAIFGEAVRCNDDFKVHKVMVDIYTAAGKIDNANDLLETMMKRYRDVREVYELAGDHFMAHGKCELARQTMHRGIKFFPPSSHVQLIVHFAAVEFRSGDAERGKTLFESLIGSYPKRTDLWSVYIDMLVKYCSVDLARAVFERVLLMKLTARQMKFYYTKWLELEEKESDPKAVEYVKQRALDSVQEVVSA